MTELDINGSRILKESISEVLETMVFMDITSCTEDEMEKNPPAVLSTIFFAGNYQGTLTMICSEECAKAITMNVWALDSEDDTEKSDIPDAMGEMANMTMGSAKSRLYEKMGELNVSVPSVVTGNRIAPQGREGELMETAFVKIDDTYPMQLTLTYLKKEG